MLMELNTFLNNSLTLNLENVAESVKEGLLFSANFLHFHYVRLWLLYPQLFSLAEKVVVS